MRTVGSLLALLLVPGGVFAQGQESVKAQYTKYEYRVPVRDGVRLFTAVYVPKDAGPDKTYPIILIRTPYSVAPYGPDAYPDALRPGPEFAISGYIFAYQDVRGRMMSEGEFVNMRPHVPAKKTANDIDESSDTYDTIDWLLKNVKGHNGKVGQTGISYPGFYTVCGMLSGHPALVAASPQAPVTDWFVGDDFHHNGALFLPHGFNFLANFGRPRPEPTKNVKWDRFSHGTPDGYQFFLDLGPLKNANSKHLKGEIAFWDEMMRHGTYDRFWQTRNIRAHIKDVRPAVLTVGGWFDAENLFGALETFKTTEANGPPKAGNHLVMGPWAHGGWSRGDGDKLGDISFHAKTGEWYRANVELPFFEHHLKGKPDPKLPKATVFETGTHVWRKYDAWPPKESKPVSFKFRGNGRLLDGRLPVDEKIAPDAHDEFVSDPAKPVPYYDRTGIGMAQPYMTADQRFAARRPDVLVYQTDPLETDLTIAGPVEVALHVSTTGTDADWIVKVIDVFPADAPDPNPNPTGVHMGNYQMLVRAEVMRGKFRDSLEKPTPFEPGKVTPVRFTLPDTCHTFRPGHRLMVQVQSSWFPLVDRNPQTFCDIYTCGEEAFRKQTHRVYRSHEYPSGVTVRVVP
jgi:putative CocE/NonD family hydrolase